MRLATCIWPARPGPGCRRRQGFLAQLFGGGGGGPCSGYRSLQGPRDALDGPGDAYVISSAAPGFPVTQGAYNFDGPSNTGAYITKLNPSGTNLLYRRISARQSQMALRSLVRGRRMRRA